MKMLSKNLTIAIIVAASLTLSSGPTANANDQLDSVNAELKALDQDLKSSRVKLESATREVTSKRAELKIVADEQRRIEAELGNAEGQISEIGNTIETLKREKEALQVKLQGKVYRLYTQSFQLAGFSNSRYDEEVQYYLKVLRNSDHQQLDSLSRFTGRIELLTASFAQIKSKVVDLLRERSEKVRAFKEEEKILQKKEAGARAMLASYESKVKKLKAKQIRLQALLASLTLPETEASSFNQDKASEDRPSMAVSRSLSVVHKFGVKGALPFPTEAGLVAKTEDGGGVPCPLSGRLSYIDELYNMGKVAIIEKDKSLLIVANMEQVFKKKGQQCVEGDLLGKGNLIYLEIRKNGKVVNPQPELTGLVKP